MAYTYKDAIDTVYDYLQLESGAVEEINNTKGRGLIYTLNDEKIVLFIYPISCKDNNRQNFFDTRDSGANERKTAWQYACDNGLKYFCLGVNSEQERYKDYILSLECNEEKISAISFRKGETGGTGTQVNIPADYIPSEQFDRILTPYNFHIAFIKKDIIKNYLQLFDNRPYMESTLSEENNGDADRISGGRNVLYYGVPGSGKSDTIDKIIKGHVYERVVFHPDYTYSDFVGQLMPRLKKINQGEEKLTYVFVPGPFTNALKAAEEHKKEMVYLVIEEINRGNAPAIFGDVFQLLDRKKDGTSRYSITNYEMAKDMFGKDRVGDPIKVPSNLSILASMNTSDQNVFTLDTAFQRRWDMKYVPNEFGPNSHKSKPVDERNEITWGDFVDFVNGIILNNNSNMISTEDKQLGAYFVKEEELNSEQFAEKALKYLWDDAFKMERDVFFDPDIKSLGTMIEEYKKASTTPLKRIMKKDVYDQMMDMTANTPVEAVDESEVFEADTANDSDQQSE